MGNLHKLNLSPTSDDDRDTLLTTNPEADTYGVGSGDGWDGDFPAGTGTLPFWSIFDFHVIASMMRVYRIGSNPL